MAFSSWCIEEQLAFKPEQRQKAAKEAAKSMAKSKKHKAKFVGVLSF